MQERKNAKDRYNNVAQRSCARAQERDINVAQPSVQACKNAKELYNNVAQRRCASVQER